MIGNIKNYFLGVWSEMSKVNWPKRKDVIYYTIIVIISVAIAMIILVGIDFVLSKGVEFLINKKA